MYGNMGEFEENSLGEEMDGADFGSEMGFSLSRVGKTVRAAGRAGGAVASKGGSSFLKKPKIRIAQKQARRGRLGETEEMGLAMPDLKNPRNLLLLGGAILVGYMLWKNMKKGA